jgi:hypothetical protein
VPFQACGKRFEVVILAMATYRQNASCTASSRRVTAGPVHKRTRVRTNWVLKKRNMADTAIVKAILVEIGTKYVTFTK